MARGNVIAFLDADDIWPQGRLQSQLERLLQDPNLEVVMGRTQYVGLLSAHRGKIRFEGPDNTAIIMHLGSAVIRKSTLEKVGNFDESLPSYEDLDWFLRAREKGVSMLILKHITLQYRMHEGNYSRTQSSEQGLMRVLKKSVIRRKSNPQQVQLPNFYDFDEGRIQRHTTDNGVGE
jgi:glycosyltransferase involved in cell wall biosynthesis